MIHLISSSWNFVLNNAYDYAITQVFELSYIELPQIQSLSFYFFIASSY